MTINYRSVFGFITPKTTNVRLLLARLGFILVLPSVASQLLYFCLPNNNPIMIKILELGLAPDIPSQSWPMTEWFINYEAGFVRRGLAGQVIKEISSFLPVPPTFLVVIISLGSFVGLSYIIKVKVGGAPFLMLYSSLFLGLPVYSNFLFRKDIFLVLLWTVSLLVIRKRGYVASVFIGNILTSLAILVHEGFVFWGLPLLFISFSIHYFKKLFTVKSLLLFSPTTFVAFACFFFNGDGRSAVIISNGWNYLLELKYPGFCCLKSTPGAIGAISWSLKQGLSLSLSVLHQFIYGFVWVPFVWGTSFVCGVLFIGKLFFLDINQRSKFYRVIIFQTLMVSPLFALGWDFGRWIFYIFFTSIIWTSLLGQRVHMLQSISKKNVQTVTTSRTLLQSLTLLFGIPDCCWSFHNYISSTPLGACARSITALITVFGK